MRIFLIGYMGSGKTTLGRPLAGRLGYPFADLDQMIEQGEGMTVGEIFATAGETRFRELETVYLERCIAEYPDVVVSTGGGTPCFHDNMELMNRSGVTVYLQLSPGKLSSRLSSARNCRPLLADKTPEELTAFISDMLIRREPYYTKANVIVADPSRDVSQLVRVLQPYYMC